MQKTMTTSTQQEIQKTTELSSPETLLTELGLLDSKDAANDSNVCEIYYLLGLRIGKWYKKWGTTPNDADVYTLWFNEGFALGDVFVGQQEIQPLLNEATEFAKRCKQARLKLRKGAS